MINEFHINEFCYLSNDSLKPDLLSLLNERPLTINELSHLTNKTSLFLLPYLSDLVRLGKITRIDNGNIWYKISRINLRSLKKKNPINRKDQHSNAVILKCMGEGIFRNESN